MSESHGVIADAAAIRTAAIAAVQPLTLVARRLMIRDGKLLLDGRPLVPPLVVAGEGRIVVVGGGKAASGMAAAVERLIVSAGIAPARLTGLVSVPVGCGIQLERIEVRETRPAGRNMPTPAAEAATREMLGLVAGLTPADIAIVIVTGGGSALVAAPRAGVPLDEKVAVATFLAAAGADIRELNTVRQAASDVKAGGLARACAAGRLLALVLSDVIGDPLEVIASGPCMPVTPQPVAARAVLERFGVIAAGIAPRLVARLEADAAVESAAPPSATTGSSWTTPRGCHVDHLLLGSNATAVESAAAAARAAGYEVVVRHAESAVTATADEVGRRLAAEGLMLAERASRVGRPLAVIEGGEAVVTLPADHGRGGRNQQMAVAALAAVRASGRVWPGGLCIASVGTDGEDGPTTAAGGLVDAGVAAAVEQAGLDVEQAAARCDAYPLLAAADGLIVTGPTGTNVADVRLVLARP
jgi:hydroxypyruvate reductase